MTKILIPKLNLDWGPKTSFVKFEPKRLIKPGDNTEKQGCINFCIKHENSDCQGKYKVENMFRMNLRKKFTKLETSKVRAFNMSI